MCGIFGKFGSRKTLKFKILGLLNQERGTHSSGVFTEKSFYKRAVTFSKFLSDKHYKKLETSRCLAGHTRFATHGQIIDKNAHPFSSGTIIGVHNGIISNFAELQAEEGTKFVVDSQIIFYLIDKYGVESLSRLNGSIGLIWYDRVENTWFFFRHSQVLHFSENELTGDCYVSSERKHLEQVSKNVEAFREGVVYSWNFKNGFVMEAEIDFPKKKESEPFNFSALNSLRNSGDILVKNQDKYDDFTYNDFFIN